uniref:BAT2_N domain-containing protein n=1 Tax=Schistosoma mansoni TaxID=6183 RepID=A0A5K4FEU8_SCHMA
MSSKVKSEKTKVKFAQSNINHVYKGNTTEPQHKPTVRQYGMQVVGKLQGTRRLPPPAWVPSIKAETGGLDSRVSLVPAGGGGWGAPSTSSADQPPVSSTTTDSLPVVSTLPSVNGALYSETVGNSLEPAYTKFAYGNSDMGVTGVSTLKDTSVGVNGPVKTNKTEEAVKDKVSSQLLKPPSDKPGSSGGLAANKPFFQRPTPIVTTSSTATTTSKSEIPTKVDGGAREIVGEPSGWVAIGQDEPDFDERIIFSDDEEYEVKPVRSTTTTNISEQSAQFLIPPPSTVKTSLHAMPMKPFVNPSTNLQGACVIQSQSTVSQNMYGSNLMTSNTWSAADVSYTRNCSVSHPGPPPLNLPYSIASINTCGITSDANRSLPSGQFMNHVTSPGVIDSFYSTHPLQSRLAVSIASGITDSVRSATDVDAELQQAQRQARTQEFKNAVERAQQARARQKLSESCSVENDNMLPKSALGLLPSMSENRPFPLVSAPFTTTACQPDPNCLFPMGDHSSVNHMLSTPPPNMLPAFPTSGPLDITAAIAAATAAAIAYTGGADSGVPERSRTEMPLSVPSVIPQTQVPMPVSSNTVTAGTWQTQFGSNNSMPAAMVRLLSQQPLMAQLLQNALKMSAGNSQVPKSTQNPQGAFLNPDFSVERFLEIFNQSQMNWPQGPPISSPKNTLSSESNTQVTISTMRHDQSSTSTVDSCLRSQFASTTSIPGNPDGTVGSQNVKESDGSSEKTRRVHRVSQSSSRSDVPVVTTSSTVTSSNSPSQRTTRVPGLMDIKVSCASSQHLAHLWDKEDHLLEPVSRGFRGRGKSLISYKPQRGSAKGRGTSKSHLLEAVTGDLKSMDLRESNDPHYSADDYDVSHRSHSVSKSSKSWRSKPSHSVDDSVIDAYNMNSRVKSGLTDDEHMRYRKQVRNITDDSCWTRTDLDNNSSPSVLSSESENNECGVLSDVQEGDGTEDDKRYNRFHTESGKKRSQHLSKFSHPNQAGVSDNKDKNKSLSTSYNRRGRRGRVGTNSHFTSSRSYTTDDFSSYSKRYSKGSEQDYYWRQYYGSGSRGVRTGHSAGMNIDQYKNHSNDDIFYRPSERQASRSITSGSFTGISGYFGGRMTRSYAQYESSRDQNKDLDSQYYVTNGRQMRPQKMYYSHKGQFSSATDFSHEYVASDNDENRSHGRSTNYPDSKAKVYAVSGRFHKTYRKNPTNTTTKSELNTQPHIDTEQVAKLTLDSTNSQIEGIDDPEVPTVRVPASDSVIMNAQYTKMRTNRFATHKVLGTSKRVSNRAGQNHQSKRLNGSVIHTTRRYREMRDRYNDEKDGDGGAAAGGAGRSGTSSGVSASIIFKTGTGGNSNSRGGNQCSGNGGHTDSAVDFVDQGKQSNNSEVVSNTANDPLDENNMNSRSLTRRRQAVGTSSRPAAGGIALQTECSKVSSSPSVISGTVQKNEKSHLSGGSSTNQHSAYRSNTRASRCGTTFYHKRNDMSSIPPLMSIKPHASFPENSYAVDSLSTWANRTERKSETVSKDDSDKFSQSRKEFYEVNQDTFEEDTPHGDGFTKVVSKASKYFARRRMQQEVSVSGDLSTRRSNGFSRNIGNVTQVYSKEGSTLTTTLSQNYVHTNDHKSQSSGLLRSLSGKKKCLPTKVSFMGPPLCLDATSSVCTVTTSILSGQTNQPVPCSSSLSATPTSSVLQKISFSTTRTWSKVVGTKFAKVPPENHGDSTKTSSSVLLNSNSVWQTEHSNHVITEESNEDKKLLDNTATTTTSNTDSVVKCSYASMQSLWSIGDSIPQANKNHSTNSTLLLASSTVQGTVVPSVGPLCTVSPSTTFSSQISNNICKVKPQQQQLLQVTSISPLISTSMHLNLLSPSNNNIIENISTADLIAETERSDFECCGDIGRPNALLRPHTSDNLQNLTTLSSNAFQSWSSSNALYTPFSLSNVPINRHESNMFSGNVWPTADQSMDMNINCMTGSYNTNSNQPHFQNQLSSNILSSVLTHNNTTPSLDGMTKQSNISITPRQQHIQSYQNSILTPADRVNIYSSGPYGNNSTELGKLSNNLCVPSQQMTYVSAAPSLYVHPQSTAIQPAPSRSFHHSLSIPIQSQMSQARKCRQQVPHQMDPSTFTAGYTSFPTDIKNEYNFPPSIAGCIPPPPSVGLYSAIHQSNYPQNSGRHAIGFPTTVNSYSLLGNPSATSNLQAAGQPYAPAIGPAAGNGGGLLPHPVPQGGYNNTPCHFPTPITSNSVSNYANASNYVGVIGGGRPNTDHSNATVRQRGLQHHNLFPHPNLPQSPSAQGQQSFQLPSSFYPSISPSHQRVSLQQFGGTSRAAITGPINPQNGLYGPAFGGASHPPNQATPPPIGHQLNPIGFYSNQFQYPSRPDGLH